MTACSFSEPKRGRGTRQRVGTWPPDIVLRPDNPYGADNNRLRRPDPLDEAQFRLGSALTPPP